MRTASLALMAVVTLQLTRAALVDGTTLGLALISGGLLFGYKLNSFWLILGGALLGLIKAFVIAAK